MSVPYTPPDYVPPEVDQASWSGPERRSRDPIDQLSRSFNRLCLEASDRFEIVANLEALGFNSPSALSKLGVSDHFALAKDLYLRTPTTFERKRTVVKPERDWLGPIAMVLALLVTFVLGAFSTSLELAPAIWILTWSQIAAALLSKAAGEIDLEEHEKVLAILMQLGLVGIAATWIATPFGVGAAAPAFLWFGVAGLLWSRRFGSALALSIVVAIAAGFGIWLSLPPEMAQIVTIAMSGAFAIPLLSNGSRRTLRWALERAPSMGFAALYGLGQGLLIIALLRQTPVDSQMVLGASLLALILLTSRALLLKLKERLTSRLWIDTDVERFVTQARWALLAYAAVYLVPLAISGAARLGSGPQPWMFHWQAFALFGLCLALAVVSLTLGDPVAPAVSFVLAGSLALFVSFLWICVLLAATQLVVLLARSARVERYAVYLL